MTSTSRLPGGLTVREGAIVVRCERCGDARRVPIGLHTFGEFWELMRSRGWRLANRGGSDTLVLCPRCAGRAAGEESHGGG